jgi:hypothetical protein
MYNGRREMGAGCDRDNDEVRDVTLIFGVWKKFFVYV